MKIDKNEQKIGPAMRKVLLLLAGGLALALSGRPDTYFRIVGTISKEWQKINRKSLHNSIRKLYRSKLIAYKEHDDGTVSLTLSDEGKKRVLRYNLAKMTIKKPSRWDHCWRVVIFDIPEHTRNGRNALAAILKRLGFYPLQKSVFIHPYDCKDEVDFIVEIFSLRPYVRFLLVKEIDIEIELNHHFKL